MTEGEWDNIVGPMWGNVDDAIDAVKRMLMEMEPHETFALHGQYNLVPSTEATLSKGPELLPEPGGEWFAYDRDGRRGSRFADSVDASNRED